MKGTGEKGRITKEDVKGHLTRSAAPAAAGTAAFQGGGMGIPEIPAVDFAKFGPIETQPLSRIKKISGAHLHRSWLNVPLVTHQDESDITETDAYRRELDAQVLRSRAQLEQANRDRDRAAAGDLEVVGAGHGLTPVSAAAAAPEAASTAPFTFTVTLRSGRMNARAR